MLVSGLASGEVPPTSSRPREIGENTVFAGDLPDVEPTEDDLYALETLSWQASQDWLDERVLTMPRERSRVAVFRPRPVQSTCWLVAA